MRCLIAYLSYSGNTEEIAQHIQEELLRRGWEIAVHEIGYDFPITDVSRYDYIFLGTFTWDMGATPDEVKDFILEIGYKPDNIAVFGSGDTQFGGDALFCKAVEKLVTFYASKWEGLKIEQSPRGTQEKQIDNWLERVLADAKVARASENIRTEVS